MAATDEHDTHHKALTINLDRGVYGTLAEIGAGQEVARWFLQVGGASGTVAKTISAYDMTFSDAIYGKVARYVSRERLEGMLDHEYTLLLDRLGATRGGEVRFFVFADTVSARNFGGTNECHGWLGIRFQTDPGGPPNDVVLHVNLMGSTNAQQRQAMGVLGVNLVYAVYHRRDSVESLLAALFEDLSLDQLEVDLIDFRGPAFAGVDERAALLELVQGGLAEAVILPVEGPPAPANEILRKRPLVLQPGSFIEPVPERDPMLAAAVRHLAAESGEGTREPLPLFALSRRPLLAREPCSTDELHASVATLRGLGAGVFVARQPELYRFVRYALRYTSAPIRIVLGAHLLAEVFQERHYADLDGELMEGLAQLFTYNVRMYVYPSARVGASAAEGGLLTLESLELPRPRSLLLRYLVESGFLQPLRDSTAVEA